MKEFTYVGIDMFCTHTFTPVFHRDDFHRVLQQKNGISAACDEKGIFRALETVLLPETPVQLVCSMQDHVVQITTDAYPYSGFFFTDQRLLRESYGHSIPMPCAEEILQRLYSCVGAPYVWGGNAPCLTEIEELYPEAETHCLSGFDCSVLSTMHLMEILPETPLHGDILEFLLLLMGCLLKRSPLVSNHSMPLFGMAISSLLCLQKS